MAIQQLQHGHGVPITPNDNAYIWQQLFYTYKVYTTLYVGVGGDLHVLTAGGDEITFTSVPSGTFLPVHVAKVFASGTTAASILALDITTQPTEYSYLLDTYSGAAAAYSLRQLSSSYSGSAIRVRRSSDNTEQNIGFASNELDVTALTSFCSGTNGFVTTWYDQSGNGNDATQSTAASQPQIVSSGSVITENGKPTLQYDGVDDQLQITSAIDLTDTFFVPLVYKSNRTSSEDYILYGDVGASRIRLYSGLYRVYIDNSTYDFTTANDNFGTQYLFTNESDSSGNLIVYRDGSALGAAQSIPGTDNWIIEFIGYGSVRQTNGLLQEIILWDSEQNTNRTGIETNINDFYNIY